MCHHQRHAVNPSMGARTPHPCGIRSLAMTRNPCLSYWWDSSDHRDAFVYPCNCDTNTSMHVARSLSVKLLLTYCCKPDRSGMEECLTTTALLLLANTRSFTRAPLIKSMLFLAYRLDQRCPSVQNDKLITDKIFLILHGRGSAIQKISKQLLNKQYSLAVPANRPVYFLLSHSPGFAVIADLPRRYAV